MEKAVNAANLERRSPFAVPGTSEPFIAP